jgi:hypothetical protein
MSGTYGNIRMETSDSLFGTRRPKSQQQPHEVGLRRLRFEPTKVGFVLW